MIPYLGVGLSTGDWLIDWESTYDYDYGGRLMIYVPVRLNSMLKFVNEILVKGVSWSIILD